MQNERRKGCPRSAATDIAWPCYVFDTFLLWSSIYTALMHVVMIRKGKLKRAGRKNIRKPPQLPVEQSFVEDV